MQPRVYTPAMQGSGEFDGGKIKEQKPIGFSGEGSVIKRVGPLFYWAWGASSAEAVIGLHPHEGFEIMTYIVQGESSHKDTLGTDSAVGAGGVQVMQTGSGVSHREQLSADTEFFQIWFEPYLAEAMLRKPTYHQYEHEDFSIESHEAGYSVKTVIGSGSPINLVADAEMWDVEISGGARYGHTVPGGYTLTALAIRGAGVWGEADVSKRQSPFRHKDFIVGYADSDTSVEITNPHDDILRLILIKVPTNVSYPLQPKR
ncbi:pirin family protein [Paenibacillus sp. P96]|uniref:Pirin family protein n=1 Tax=Paenibacillus zeirhizosphaerae TaxID=2987519 RepID=A0ABT9FXJ3_9BACL|nr:pirin family protein [Paenibacillus sp. P96]MDP4099453.1 pirin family protein [Paenibacillus sp. P96]